MATMNTTAQMEAQQHFTKLTNCRNRKRLKNSLCGYSHVVSSTYTSISLWMCLLTVVFCLVALCPYPARALMLDARGRLISQHPRCRDARLKDATKMADVVVSGKVVKLLQDEAHSTIDHRMMKGEIEVKRVFKGENMVDQMAEIMPGRLRPHKMVMVEGFGDPGICHNSVRERDTKIFLLKPNGNGELKLNSSVVTLTLRNLDYVDAVVHSEYKGDNRQDGS
ncbi:agrin-like [Plakobranchus ocellatus]|uniref:Agrin-like n=1 Tax=Plakobranchus ocellatus TaxID=259542 RepID=A0AAV4B6X8_9GAST|nr:agrin-like [Plakobranchus ocellatus]